MKHTLLAASVLLTVILSTPAQADCYSEGIRVGVVQKISKKGMINKSWEGELVMKEPPRSRTPTAGRRRPTFGSSARWILPSRR